MMSFRRGLFLGLLVGLVSGVVSGEPSSSRVGTAGEAGGRSLLDEARAAAKAEREATEARLEERFRVAKATGHTPEADSAAGPRAGFA